MKLRKRILFMLTPLVLLPLFLVLLFFLFFLQKTSPDHFETFGQLGFSFLAVFSVIVIMTLAGLANSITRPILKVIDGSKRMAGGDWDHPIQEEHIDDEMGELVGAIEEMKSSLKQQKKAIEESAALSAIGRQSAQVAHDIRGPISSIRLCVDYFSARDDESEKIRRHLDLMSLSSRRLFNIAEDLVRKYRGEKEQRQLFSLHHILNNLVGEFSAQDRYSGIRFEKSFYSSDICVFQERPALERVFANLIKNALEAMGLQGNLKVRTALEDGNAIVRIADDGCGIEKDKIPLIFNERYTSGKEGGTGLGLAYVKKTVEGAGGEITIESQLGEGTVFTLKFPAAKEKDLQTPPLQGPGEVATLPKERKDYKVIVIDDDMMIRMGWELGTGKLGIEKLHAFESLEKMMEAELDLGVIDLAFVDKNIEGSRHSGAETIEYLKKQGIKKVVLASGEGSKALREDPNFAKADFIINEKIPASFQKFYS